HWCLLSEIKHGYPLFSNQFWVKDKEGTEYLVAFHLQDRSKFLESIRPQCKDGYTLCLMDAEKHLFFDGQIGVRVQDERVVKILPCSLEKLFDMKRKAASKPQGHCTVCGAAAALGCSKCKSVYCNQKCQLLDWNRDHKKDCVVLKEIFNFGEFVWDWFKD
ncbi:hypothetical protein FB45DRAFT_750876, partial [Roridomyces roridus]